MKKEFIRGGKFCYHVTLITSPGGSPEPEEGSLMKNEKNVLELATIRRNRGISLEQIAESTKISVRSLEAIERGISKTSRRNLQHQLHQAVCAGHRLRRNGNSGVLPSRDEYRAGRSGAGPGQGPLQCFPTSIGSVTSHFRGTPLTPCVHLEYFYLPDWRWLKGPDITRLRVPAS